MLRRLYRRWNENPLSGAVHWLAFITIGIVLANNILFSIGEGMGEGLGEHASTTKAAIYGEF